MQEHRLGAVGKVLVDRLPGALPVAVVVDDQHAVARQQRIQLLQLVARGKPGRVVLEYVDGLGLAIEVEA